ncbi:hypothetical protein GCM10009663_36250 [Kitasatospora arboriphila]|uniref:GNAT family N-acetyltransferase n=1 Tax=Kitasatospora arboriphila TaxID=258052 RepID=A0ABP4E3E1_9ACTN
MARAGRPHLALLGALLASTDAAGIRTVQSGVFPESTAGLALHARAGFRVVGTREGGGRPSGRPRRDVVLLERRSPVVDWPRPPRPPRGGCPARARYTGGAKGSSPETPVRRHTGRPHTSGRPGRRAAAPRGGAVDETFGKA